MGDHRASFAPAILKQQTRMRPKGAGDMVFRTHAPGLSWTGVLLAGIVAFTPGGAALAGEAPREEAAGRLDAPALARVIDEAIQKRQSAENATPAHPADC